MIKRLLLVAGFALMIMLLFSQIHEVTHYQIGKYYGCNGEIQWDFLDVNKTVTDVFNGEQPAFMSTHWDSNCQNSEVQILAQSVNEIIGYNVVPLIEILLIMAFTYMIIGPPIRINLKKKKKGNITTVTKE